MLYLKSKVRNKDNYRTVNKKKKKIEMFGPNNF